MLHMIDFTSVLHLEKMSLTQGNDVVINYYVNNKTFKLLVDELNCLRTVKPSLEIPGLGMLEFFPDVKKDINKNYFYFVNKNNTLVVVSRVNEDKK